MKEHGFPSFFSGYMYNLHRLHPCINLTRLVPGRCLRVRVKVMLKVAGVEPEAFGSWKGPIFKGGITDFLICLEVKLGR